MKRDKTDSLSTLLRRADPAATEEDVPLPVRRAALLERCATDVASAPLRRVPHPAFGRRQWVGVLAMVTLVAVIGRFIPTAPTERPQRQIAVATPRPVPTPFTREERNVASVPIQKAVVAVRRRVFRSIRLSSRKKQPKHLRPEPTTPPLHPEVVHELAVERVIIVQNDPPENVETPPTASVAIAITDHSHSVIVSAPATNL